jgi:glycosyltransferase involved in cell wall biosynthesis
MGKETEIIFIEGGSLDDTFHLIQQEIHAHPDRPCRLLKQSNTGKADAIHLGFEQASGDLLMVLDADLTVPPEELPRFFSAIVSGKGDFINGVRLVYPMEKVAMPFLNMLGNKVFSLLFSWLLGQPVKDTLCGTKVFWRSDYHSIAGFQSSWKVKDPFGDFELLFGAARLNLKIVDMPVRYQQRMYGKSKTRRWEHGWLLLKMAWVAARNLKFV